MPIPAGSTPPSPPLTGPLVYDPVLSRVRITGVTYLNANPYFETDNPVLNANPYFETDVANWAVSLGGAISRATAQAHEGSASLLLTPDGTSATVGAVSEQVPVTVGRQYRASAWVRCAAARSVNLHHLWYDSTGAFLSLDSTSFSVPATTWTLLDATFIAPAGASRMAMRLTMGSTPPASALLYVDEATLRQAEPANWAALGGTLTRSTAQAHQGVASGLFTPDGVSASVEARSTAVPVTVGRQYRASAWVRCPFARTVDVGVVWRDAANAFVSSSLVAASVAANTWTFIDGTHNAPAGATQAQLVATMGGTPPATHTLYIDEATVGPSVVVERSTDQVTWVAVRGGSDLPGGTFKVSDYEFAADVPNYYRTPGWVGSITPPLDTVWLKSVARPFLNRPVSVRDFSEVSRQSRGGVFEVVGRSFPVAVTDVRGSRRWTLELATDTPQEATTLDLLLAGGDILLVHVPQNAGRISAVPGGYVTVGDTRIVTPPTYDLQMRVLQLPLVEVAAPGPDVIGATVTCQTVLNAYGTCQQVLDAHPTCLSLMELVGEPTDVIVP